MDNWREEFLKFFGIETQAGKLVEEAKELEQAIKGYVTEPTLGNYINMVEELVDVDIVKEQLEVWVRKEGYRFGDKDKRTFKSVYGDTYDTLFDAKIERTRDRIASGYYDSYRVGRYKVYDKVTGIVYAICQTKEEADEMLNKYMNMYRGMELVVTPDE